MEETDGGEGPGEKVVEGREGGRERSEGGRDGEEGETGVMEMLLSALRDDPCHAGLLMTYAEVVRFGQVWG